MTYLVGGVPMELPLILGAGVAKHPSKLQPYMRADAPVGAVVTGSYTPKGRDGNLEIPQQWPDTWEDFEQNQFMLNAWGMPNVGFHEASHALFELEAHKPIIVSIAGFSVQDYIDGVQVFDGHPNVSAIELNFGCPNAHDQKTVPIAYDLEDMQAILDAIQTIWPRKPLWIKLSPYATQHQIEVLSMKAPRLNLSHVPTTRSGFATEARDLLQKYHHVKALVFSNTLPNVVYHQKDGCNMTGPNNGKAGLSGPLLKELALDCLFGMRSGHMHRDVDLIGCGGILSGGDIQDYAFAGARAFAAVSGPDMLGIKFLADLLQDDLAQFIFTEVMKDYEVPG